MKIIIVKAEVKVKIHKSVTIIKHQQVNVNINLPSEDFVVFLTVPDSIRPNMH